MSEYPVASPVARLQARTDIYVTNLWHQRIQLNAFEQALLPLVDGTRNVPALVGEMAGSPHRGR